MFMRQRLPFRKKSFAATIFLISAGAIVYFNSLCNPFIWDDVGLIVKNPVIKSPSNFTSLFEHGLFEHAVSDVNVYRPIQALSYTIDYSVYGLNPIGYHFGNIILHTLNAIFLFFIFKRHTLDVKVPLIATLLFIIHPIHTQAVTYISGRADLLMSFFILASFWLYIKSRANINDIAFLTSLLLFVLALLSKEAAIIFPCVLFIYHILFLKGTSKRLLILFLVVALCYIFLRLTALSFGGPNLFQCSVNLSKRMLTFTKVFWVYIGILILPFNLHMERTISVSKSISELTTSGSIIGLLIIAATIIALRKNKFLLFSILWSFIFLIPVSGIVPLNAILAEHWLYLPSFGFFIVLAYLLNKLFKRKKILALILLVGLVLFYSFLTIKRNSEWSNPEEFYKQILAYNPNSFRALNNLAVLYFDTEQFEKAIDGFKKVLEIKPDDFHAFHNLGMAYAQIGQKDLAKEYYGKAIKVNPKDTSTYYNLANLYREEGDLNQAIYFYKKSIDVNPNYYFAYNNLANIYSEQRDYQKAIEFYKKAIKINPDYTIARYNLGAVYFKKSDLKAAYEEWKKVLELQPDHKDAKKNMEQVKNLLKK